MINQLRNEKKYFGKIIGILFLFAVITLIIWRKIPNEIYIPLRWNGQREVGFYEKNFQNAVYVFLTPFLGTTIIKIANIVALGGRNDLFSLAISESLDLLCYLFVVMGPLAFLICSFFQNGLLAYVFYFIGLVILVINFRQKGYR